MNIRINSINDNRSNYRFNNITFQAMKKSQFHGIDRFIVDRYKAPIEKFNIMDDFYNFCKEKVEQIKATNFGGLYKTTVKERKSILNKWFKYVTTENAAYTLPIQMMILAAITSNLKRNEDTTPPALNKGVLASTVESVQDKLESGAQNINFEKEYKTKLKESMLEDKKSTNHRLTRWVIIPSKKHDPVHFNQNVEKLKMLSHHNWCTKSFNAKPYLSEGDFHVFLDNGNPALGVRFIEDEIYEIQGEKNDNRIPLKYFDLATKYTKKYNLSKHAIEQLRDINPAEVENLKAKYPEGINSAPVEEIFKALRIECQKDDDGKYIISHYMDSSEFEINEDRLLENVKTIMGSANFSNSSVTKLDNLEHIGGNADFRDSKVTDLKNLKTIGGNAYFSNSKIEYADSLESIGGDADFYDSQDIYLDNLKFIGGNANFSYSRITNLENLEKVNGNADFHQSKIAFLDNLDFVGGNLDIRNIKIEEFPIADIEGNVLLNNRKYYSYVQNAKGRVMYNDLYNIFH